MLTGMGLWGGCSVILNKIMAQVRRQLSQHPIQQPSGPPGRSQGCVRFPPPGREGQGGPSLPLPLLGGRSPRLEGPDRNWEQMLKLARPSCVRATMFQLLSWCQLLHGQSEAALRLAVPTQHMHTSPANWAQGASRTPSSSLMCWAKNLLPVPAPGRPLGKRVLRAWACALSPTQGPEPSHPPLSFLKLVPSLGISASSSRQGEFLESPARSLARLPIETLHLSPRLSSVLPSPLTI